MARLVVRWPTRLPMMTSADEGDLLLRVAGKIPADEFHPFVVRVARRLGLRGWVRHDGSGVVIRAAGLEEQLVQLVRAIRDDAPPGVSVRGMAPEAVTVHTAAVGEDFVPLVEEAAPAVAPEPPSKLAKVA